MARDLNTTSIALVREAISEQKKKWVAQKLVQMAEVGQQSGFHDVEG